MLTRRVIAADIANLTDARYFAARGVDYLMFDLSHITLERLLEIKEWVEGPAAILLVDESTLDLIEEAILRVSPVAIVCKSPHTIGELQHYQAHVEVAHMPSDHVEVGDQIFRSVTTLDGLASLDSQDGIIITGGDEEEVGVKDFDILDSIFDELEED